MHEIRNYDYTGRFKSVNELALQLQDKNYQTVLKQIDVLKHEITDYDFPLDKNTYSRHILSKNNGNWLLLIHWDKNVLTSIHGHPASSFVYVLNGLMEVESFALNPLKSLSKKTVLNGEYFHNNGLINRFDNAVHRVHTIEQTLSLHFYSDDPTKGTIFTL